VRQPEATPTSKPAAIDGRPAASAADVFINITPTWPPLLAPYGDSIWRNGQDMASAARAASAAMDQLRDAVTADVASCAAFPSIRS